MVGVGGDGRRRWLSRLAVATGLAAALTGCSRKEPARTLQDIEVSDAYAVEPVSSEVAAVYLTIRNHGTVADTLLGARTPVAAMVFLHRMGGLGGAVMRAQAGAEVPAGGLLQLRPGGLHLMLMNLASQPHAGDTIDMTVELRRAGAVALRVPVVSYLEAGERAAVGTPDDNR
jgi:copper(I)-binding protein